MQKLLNSELDIAIVEGKIKHPDIVTKSIINDNLVLICSHKHEFYKRDSIKVSELSNQPLIMRELGSGTRAQLEKQLKELKIPMNIRWSCYNSEAILRAVVDNFGIAVISELLIEDYLKSIFCGLVILKVLIYIGHLILHIIEASFLQKIFQHF